ncbi:MAG TPA: hypothetical protein VK422_17815 [Pyrinomonadaceae bacterium]|nr:hypothetical protein [Pyrinomonadaceae bacterium]
MKRYPLELKTRAYNKRRAAKSLRAQVQYKDWKRKHNANNVGVKRTYNPVGPSRPYKSYRHVVAPRIFTLLQNPEPVISFINVLKKHFIKKQKVFVVLRDVEQIDYDAIVVLLSIMIRFKAQGIPFNGDFPEHGDCRKKLDQSGFIKNLYKSFENEDEYAIESNQTNYITRASKLVVAKLTAEIIQNASRAVWGEPRRSQGVQTTLQELMLNTNNHASPRGKGDMHWWLSVNYSENEKKMRFSFVDYGIGIFESLSSKPANNIFYGALKRLLVKAPYKNNAELLRLIMNGELHRSVTNEYYRGQGLPGILDSMKENWFSRLHVISNDVFANVAKGEYRLLNGVNFPGTFIYWEVDSSNRSFEVKK